MATSFPGAIDSYSTKQNNVDFVEAGHINNLQDAMVATQTAFGVQTTWTPVLTQPGAVAHTVSFAKYVLNTRTKMVHIECKLVITGTGTGGNAIYLTGWGAGLNPAHGDNHMVGHFSVLDSGTRLYAYPALWNSIGISGFDNVTAAQLGSNPNFALANTDEVYLNATWFVV